MDLWRGFGGGRRHWRGWGRLGRELADIREVDDLDLFVRLQGEVGRKQRRYEALGWLRDGCRCARGGRGRSLASPRVELHDRVWGRRLLDGWCTNGRSRLETKTAFGGRARSTEREWTRRRCGGVQARSLKGRGSGACSCCSCSFPLSLGLSLSLGFGGCLFPLCLLPLPLFPFSFCLGSSSFLLGTFLGLHALLELGRLLPRTLLLAVPLLFLLLPPLARLLRELEPVLLHELLLLLGGGHGYRRRGNRRGGDLGRCHLADGQRRRRDCGRHGVAPREPARRGRHRALAAVGDRRRRAAPEVRRRLATELRGRRRRAHAPALRRGVEPTARTRRRATIRRAWATALVRAVEHRRESAHRARVTGRTDARARRFLWRRAVFPGPMFLQELNRRTLCEMRRRLMC